MRKGIDVAYYDRGMDWSRYTWDFAFIKVSEGTVIDPEFDIHWTKAKGHTQRGGYHFFRAFVDPRMAAQRFLEYLDGDLGELPPVCDGEATNGIEVKTVVSRTLTWLTECEKRTGITPIYYSSPNFITNVLKLHLYPDFSRYPLWLAVYLYDEIYPGYTEADRAKRIHDILTETRALPIITKPKPFLKMPYIQWTAKGSPFDVPGYYTGTGHKEAVDFNFQLEEQPVEPDLRISIRSVA